MRFNVRKLALLLLLAAPAAQAQLWSGPGAVEVQAEDQKGHDLAGARVLLVYTALDPKDGPPAAETDARGRVNVGGLAEGAWHVEVSHDGFMTYMAEINVRKGKPELVDATQFRVPGGGTSLMRVKISRGSPTAPPARASAPPPVPASGHKTGSSPGADGSASRSSGAQPSGAHGSAGSTRSTASGPAGTGAAPAGDPRHTSGARRPFHGSSTGSGSAVGGTGPAARRAIGRRRPGADREGPLLRRVPAGRDGRIHRAGDPLRAAVPAAGTSPRG